MAHPVGGQGSMFHTNHTFQEVTQHVGNAAIQFISTTGELITAHTAMAEDGITNVFVFTGDNHRHGSACDACWGNRKGCNGSYIGQCVEAMDAAM